MRPTIYGLFEIYSSGGGIPPLPLQGRYTSVEYAQKAIDKYAASRG